MEAARPATADDLDSIVNVAERVRAEQHGARGAALFAVREGGLWPPRGRLTAAVEAEDTIVVVGTYDDVVFGYGVAVIEPLLDGGLLGDLKDFAVEPDARSVGIGEAMMNELVDRLRARGCYRDRLPGPARRSGNEELLRVVRTQGPAADRPSQPPRR